MCVCVCVCVCVCIYIYIDDICIIYILMIRAAMNEIENRKSIKKNQQN